MKQFALWLRLSSLEVDGWRQIHPGAWSLTPPVVVECEVQAFVHGLFCLCLWICKAENYCQKSRDSGKSVTKVMWHAVNYCKKSRDSSKIVPKVTWQFFTVVELFCTWKSYFVPERKLFFTWRILFCNWRTRFARLRNTFCSSETRFARVKHALLAYEILAGFSLHTCHPLGIFLRSIHLVMPNLIGWWSWCSCHLSLSSLH